MRVLLLAVILVVAAPLPAVLAAPTPQLTAQKSFEAHAARTRAMEFDTAGSVLVSGGSDRRVCVWDTKTWKRRAVWASPPRPGYKP